MADGLDPSGGEVLQRDETTVANNLRSQWADWCARLWRARKKLRPTPVYRFHVEPILADTQLSPQAKVCYCHLLIHADGNGEVIQSVAQIAAGIGLQNRRTQDLLSEVVTRGLVRKIQYHPHKPAHYFLVPVPGPLDAQQS